MHHFEYVPKKVYMPEKKKVIEMINQVQDLVRDDFTFRYDFIGSAKLNMVTCDPTTNIGYDFDVNIEVNDDEQKYSAKEIKQTLMNAFDKVVKKYGYDHCEDSTSVFTVKIKDARNSRILHSVDFAVVNNLPDGRQKYIKNNKAQRTYTWEFRPHGYFQEDKIEYLKENGHWEEVKDRYLDLKNGNKDPNEKSRTLRAQTINDIYNKYSKKD